MDIDWMRGKLEHFLDHCERYDRASSLSPEYDAQRMKPIDDDIADALPTVQRIIQQLDPALIHESFGIAEAYIGMSESTRRTRMAVAVLRDREEWAIHLAPDAPSLSSDELHPSIWGAAAAIWPTGEYKLAAGSACTSLSAQIKFKAHSHLNDRDLAAQVFKPDPPTASQVRLHFPGDPSDKNWQSRQQGLHLLAQGAFAGIRNIAVHDDVVWTEHQALEHLAVLSVVARWTEGTQLVSA